MKKADYKLQSQYKPSGDQPQAIEKLVAGVRAGKQDQVLLGVTGSGKTFTMANIIAQTGKPALIMAHNKILAGQLYEEFKEFFPDHAVEYFVSYYDYYQPEAYVPRSGTFIEKQSTTNEQIDRMRHSATRALFERRDVIIIASVSCIYGIGDPESYSSMVVPIEVGDTLERKSFIDRLVELQYSRNDMVLSRGTFRARGEVIEVFPSHLEDAAWRLEFFDDEVERITVFDPLTGHKIQTHERVVIYPNSHYVVPKPQLNGAIENIKVELEQTLQDMEKNNRLVEAQRLNERTTFDLEMMKTMGFCSGIENYSRHLSGRKQGESPPTLFDYLPDDALLFVDESHVSVPQVRGMSRGDRARKQTLVEHGFRLPSALDNRPLTFEEWDERRPQTVYVSATPAAWELERAGGELVEQVIRPTGLVDPIIEVRPAEGQVDDLMAEIAQVVAKGLRVMATTLTKKMAEQLTDYLTENGIAVRYMHADIEALERAEIIRDLRLKKFDVLIGINLLREGLDIPELGVIAILDADKEGYLRSSTALIQTIGRAARNVEGRAILYADKITDSMKRAMDETQRRREIQEAHNMEHGITPKGIVKSIKNYLERDRKTDDGEKKGKGVKSAFELKVAEEQAQMEAADLSIEKLRKQMVEAAENLEFEKAAALRDQLRKREEKELLTKADL